MMDLHDGDRPRTLPWRAAWALWCLPRRALWVVLRLYQLLVSPVLPPACRYYPSCSQFAAEAILVHGAVRGSWLAARRLLRCHPYAPGGPDPVPPLSSRQARVPCPPQPAP